MEATQAILDLVRARGPGASICPSEAARAMAAEWRPHLGAVKQAALRLMAEGRIEILRKGRPVADAAAVRGVIRLRIAPAGQQTTRRQTGGQEAGDPMTGDRAPEDPAPEDPAPEDRATEDRATGTEETG